MASGQRGIVMQVSGQKAVLLTPTGEFVQVRLNKPANVGEEVFTDSKRMFAWKKLSGRSAVAMFAAVVVFGLGFGQLLMGVGPRAEAYAFVSVDANPSISFDLNRNLQVIRVHALNSKGTQLARELHVTGEPIDTAIADMMKQAASQGSIASNDAIIITASSPSQNADLTALQSKVKADVSDALKTVSQDSTATPQVYAINVPDSVWNEAEKAKVSPSKYATYLLAKKAGVAVNLQDIHSSNEQLVLVQASNLKDASKQLGDSQAQAVTDIVQSVVTEPAKTKTPDTQAPGLQKKAGSTTPPVAAKKTQMNNHSAWQNGLTPDTSAKQPKPTNENEKTPLGRHFDTDGKFVSPNHSNKKKG